MRHTKTPLLRYMIVFKVQALQAALSCFALEFEHASLGHHHLDKLFIIDLTISIHIGLPDHFINLFIGQLLPKVCHYMAELSSANESVAIAVKDFEGFHELLLSIGVLHLSGHERQELREVNRPIAISINLVDHVLQLCLRWVLAQRTHYCAQLLRCDSAITIFIEERKCLFEFCNLFLCELVGHGKQKSMGVQ